jgi:hypothetical protein
MKSYRRSTDHESISESDPPLSTAYHEAGHSVAAILWFRSAFKSVSVVEIDDVAGRVLSRGPGKWFRPDIEVDGKVRRRIEREIMILWAGPLSEQRFTGEFNDIGAGLLLNHDDPKQAGPLLAGSDLSAIVTLGGYVASGSDEETSAYIEWLRLRTLNEMNRPGWYFWPCVEALAEALLERRTMRYRQARDLVWGTQQHLLQEDLAARKPLH